VLTTSFITNVAKKNLYSSNFVNSLMHDFIY